MSRCVVTVVIESIYVSILREMAEVFVEAVILDDDAVWTVLAISVKKKEIHSIGRVIVVRVKLLKIIPNRELSLQFDAVGVGLEECCVLYPFKHLGLHRGPAINICRVGKLASIPQNL